MGFGIFADGALCVGSAEFQAGLKCRIDTAPRQDSTYESYD
jgi:hypothetical protein